MRTYIRFIPHYHPSSLVVVSHNPSEKIRNRRERGKKKNNVTISCTIFYPLIMSVWTTKPKRYSYVLVFGWIFFTQIKILAWNDRVSGRRRAKRMYELNIRVECRHTSQWEIEVIIFVGHLPAPGENVWSSYWNARNCVHVIRNTGGHIFGMRTAYEKRNGNVIS